MKRLSNLQIDQLEDYDWTAYFSENAEKRLHVKFPKNEIFTEEERKLITPSIQMFQLGEASEGTHLLETVKDYVKRTGDEPYLDAMRLFIAEENRHSYYLRKFMEHYKIPLKSKNDLDSTFRNLRKVGGLKGEVIVLVTAEIIALSYYRALAECTGSRALKRICAQMLYDELRHIVFQSHALYKLGCNGAEEAFRIFFMETVMDVVWLRMKNIFLAGGYSYRRLKRECMGYLRQSVFIARYGEV